MIKYYLSDYETIPKFALEMLDHFLERFDIDNKDVFASWHPNRIVAITNYDNDFEVVLIKTFTIVIDCWSYLEWHDNHWIYWDGNNVNGGSLLALSYHGPNING